MYNEELKIAFIQDLFPTREMNWTSLFNKFEPLENKYGKDLFQFSKEELIAAVDNSVRANTERAKNMYISELRTYLRWCDKKGFQLFDPSAAKPEKVCWNSSGIFINAVGSPRDLDRCLNEVFESIEKQTIDCTYRALYWFSFMGFELSKAVLIKNGEVNLEQKIITQGNANYHIPEEAIETLEVCKYATQFNIIFPNRKGTSKDRFLGDYILRGFNETTKNSIRVQASNKINNAYQNNKTNRNLKYSWVRLSGIFYRKYLEYGDTDDVDFSDVIEMFARKARRKENVSEMNQRKAKNNTTLALKNDFIRWKAVFSEELKQK